MERVMLHPYDPQWKQMFLLEKEKLEAVLGDVAAAVEHIGSTAVPGAEAKPVIDIAVAVRKLEEIEACQKELEDIGYTFVYHEAFPERRFFRKGAWRAGTHHLHVYEAGSLSWKRKLLFRDYLIRHPDLQQQYLEVKRTSAKAHPNDRQAYTESKGAFIASVLKKAEAEQRGGEA